MPTIEEFATMDPARECVCGGPLSMNATEGERFCIRWECSCTRFTAARHESSQPGEMTPFGNSLNQSQSSVGGFRNEKLSSNPDISRLVPKRRDQSMRLVSWPSTTGLQPTIAACGINFKSFQLFTD
jgi:hypothetical protein